jgi:hypothetical protein
MAKKASTPSLEKQAALRRQSTPLAAKLPAGAAPSVLPRAVANPQAARPSEILALQRQYGNQAVQRLLVSRQGEAPGLQTPPLANSITPLLQRQPRVQRVTLPPNFKQKYSLSEAATQLHTSRGDGSENIVVGNWIQYIVQKITPPAGPVKSTYVSSFDTAKGGFSASRLLPDVPDLVVHAHYQRQKQVDTATVNSAQVKWADKEEGDPPPGQTKIPPPLLAKMLGATHDKEAIGHWNKNPDRHQLRAKAKEIKAKKDWNKDKDKSLWGDGGGVPDWLS